MSSRNGVDAAFLTAWGADAESMLIVAPDGPVLRAAIPDSTFEYVWVSYGGTGADGIQFGH